MNALTVEEAADQAGRDWYRSFTWHLDQIPPLMETIAMLRLPRLGVSRGGSQFDRPQITGGGYYDTVPITDASTGDGSVLWELLAEYVKAVTAWLNVTIPTPYAPDLPTLAGYRKQWAKPSLEPDPLSARRIALEAVGWLVDRADRIYPIEQLDEWQEQLFAEVRRVKGRHGSTATRRRARPRVCATCGSPSVVADWVTGPDGQGKQVTTCGTCGFTD